MLGTPDQRKNLEKLSARVGTLASKPLKEILQFILFKKIIVFFEDFGLFESSTGINIK